MGPPRYVSFRYLVPSIERSVASPNGRPVDLLTRCYRAVVLFHGVPVIGEFYWTEQRDFLPNNIDPMVMWDDDFWRVPCPRKIQLIRGVNPCPPELDPGPVPDSWTNPELIASDTVTLAANEKGSNLWWY